MSHLVKPNNSKIIRNTVTQFVDCCDAVYGYDIGREYYGLYTPLVGISDIIQHFFLNKRIADYIDLGIFFQPVLFHSPGVAPCTANNGGYIRIVMDKFYLLVAVFHQMGGCNTPGFLIVQHNSTHILQLWQVPVYQYYRHISGKP